MRALVLLSLLVLCFTWTVRPNPSREAIEVIEGIMVGAFGEIGHEVQECIKDGETIFKDIEEAIQHFEKKSRSEIIAGLEKIGDALKLIPEEVKDCESVKELVKDFEKIAAEFSNPEELIVRVGEEILWHGKTIYHDVTGCVADFKKGEYEHAGVEIGDIIKILFIKLSDVVIDAEQFLEGFFKGALEDDSIEINDCITDATEIIEEFETIINDFKTSGIEDLEKLFLDFIDLITDSVESVVQCEKTPAELDIMLDWTVEMQDYKLMGQKLFNAFLYYPEKIKADMKNMIDDFEAHDYSDSGFSIGDFLHILFIDVSEVNEDYLDDAIEFVTGFYKKAFQINLKLDTCEADVEDEWNLLKKAIDELEKLSIESIKEGVEDLMKAIPEFIQAFDECKSDWPDLERGLIELSPFITNPTHIPWAISKACTLHFIRVESDASQIYHAFHDSPHNFENGGEGSGDLTALLLSELNMVGAENQVISELK